MLQINALCFFMALLVSFQADTAHSLRLEHSVDGGKSFKLIGDVDIDPVRLILCALNMTTYIWLRVSLVAAFDVNFRCV